MRTHLSRFTVLAVLAALLCGPLVSTARAVTDKQVREAIAKGVQFIYEKQNKAGHWEKQAKSQAEIGDDAPRDWSGLSSLAVYSLLSAGEQWQGNPKLYNAIKFLAEAKTKGTYAVGLRAHVWPKLPDRSSEVDFLRELEEDAYLLVEVINKNGKVGRYRYTLPSNNWDNSCTQYGALGSWECAKRGIGIPPSHWQLLENHFLQCQTVDGGWSYTGSRKPTIQMTAAGLACLYITLDYLHFADFQRPGVSGQHPVYQSIQKGLEWMNANFKASANGYNMVGVERVGQASGWKYFNGKDWYQQGAERFIKSQKGNGQIGSGGHGGGVVNTSFALVFLSRGRVPVFANKLAIPDIRWDNRPRDLANLTKWASHEFETDMNWQVVPMTSDADEWLDAPILYIASDQNLELNDRQKAKLKRFVDLGGLIVAVPDGGSRSFGPSLKELFTDIYPDYRFAQVGQEDSIFNINYKLRNQQVESLSNGVRHLVLYIPRDVGLNFQMNSHRDASPWQLMGNIFLYAIEKDRPRPRLEQHVLQRTGRASGTVHVGRAEFKGNWDPEPGAWEILDVFAANEGKTNFTTHTLKLEDIGDADVSMVHVTGTGQVEFTDQQIGAINQFAEGGGVIVFEAAGGDMAFSQSVKSMLRNAFPDQPLRPMAITAPPLSGDGITGGYDNTRVDFRRFYKLRTGVMDNRPMLGAVTVDGQPRVIVSSEDLSNALLGQPVWGVFGYDTESARQLMTNIGLWAGEIHPADGEIEEADADEVARRG